MCSISMRSTPTDSAAGDAAEASASGTNGSSAALVLRADAGMLTA